MEMTEGLCRWGAAAQSGDAEAQYNLGRMYMTAKGAARDYEAAYDWLLKAATRGYAEAQSDLGWMFSNALGVPQDDTEAVKWFRLAAEQNNVSAQNNLGWMLKNGRGCEQDDEEAVMWYRKSAEQNNPTAQDNLGGMLRHGRGCEKNDAVAASWYRKAADQDCPYAQLHLGLMCREGTGIPKDLDEAVNWLRKSADQGETEAAYALGEMYERAEGVKPDHRTALMYYKRAANLGHAAARARIQALRAANPDETQGIILPSGEMIEGSFVTFPRLLAERIRASTSDDERLQLVNELTHFYVEYAPGRAPEQNWMELANSFKDLNARAEALVGMGGRLEACAVWTIAIQVYQEAIHLEPAGQKMWYFAHNNLGFCLNQLGRFDEGEAFCRQALKIDATRSNAYKNTGLALQGQGRFVEAAELFITGTLTRPQDGRSLDHLIELLESHPEIREKLPTIDADIEKCRAAVETA